jgi:hypothetical protein
MAGARAHPSHSSHSSHSPHLTRHTSHTDVTSHNPQAKLAAPLVSLLQAHAQAIDPNLLQLAEAWAQAEAALEAQGKTPADMAAAAAAAGHPRRQDAEGSEGEEEVAAAHAGSQQQQQQQLGGLVPEDLQVRGTANRLSRGIAGGLCAAVMSTVALTLPWRPLLWCRRA